MPVNYADLAPGQEISDQTYILDGDTVARYAEAVGDESDLREELGDSAVIPTMAVAALGLRGVLTALEIPGGALHAGQELEHKRAVHVGEALTCRSKVAQNSVRGEWRFMVVDLAIEDGEGRPVMSGKSTIMLPRGG